MEDFSSLALAIMLSAAVHMAGGLPGVRSVSYQVCHWWYDYQGRDDEGRPSFDYHKHCTIKR